MMANPDGTPIWFELTTPDQDAAQDFYEAVAGWRIAPSPMPEHGGYRIAGAGDGEAVGGIMAPPPGTAGMPGWTLYFAANDVDAVAARVTRLGGTLFMAPMDIPHVGRFAVVGDPQGVAFSIMQGASPEGSTAFRTIGSDASLGHGVWIELATPDPDGALAFYAALFGWSKQGAMPMGAMGDYVFLGTRDGVRPGAMMSSTTTGAPARWNWYVQVPDIDAAIAAAQEKGGTLIQGPDQIPGGDYSANLDDEQGFRIGIVGPRV
jgi:hypothetical protein